MWSPLALDPFVEPPPHVAAEPRPIARTLSRLAVGCLIEEVDLTPKPGLVDTRGPGAHADLDIDVMHRSAKSLGPCFEAMAVAAHGRRPGREIREKLAEIGREGERTMFAATGGVNTHKGAIWAMGLLTAGCVIATRPDDPEEIARMAAEIARHPDGRMPTHETNGSRVTRRFGVRGARGQAEEGFPHVVEIGLPALRAARTRGVSETSARLDALLAIMSELDDTCLLHRGGLTALETAKSGAAEILRLGGTATTHGARALEQLDIDLLNLNASPGGSGDLFAATLFLDAATRRPVVQAAGIATDGVSQPWKY